MHVLLTCPRALLCNAGVSVLPRPGRRDPHGDLRSALDELDGEITRRGDRYTVLLRDPADVIVALRTFEALMPDQTKLSSFVASAAAMEMILDDAEPIRTAWPQLRERWVSRFLPTPLDMRAGCCVVGHFSGLLEKPTPDAIADQQLPPGLVLWSVHGDCIISVDRDPFEIEQVTFRRTHDGWSVDGKFYLGDQFVGTSCDLQPGMVVQLPQPVAYVVVQQ